MFRKRKLLKKLCDIGSKVDTQYLVYVNEFDPVSFSNRDECYSYLKKFREDNIIHRLQMYRIETFSL